MVFRNSNLFVCRGERTKEAYENQHKKHTGSGVVTTQVICVASLGALHLLGPPCLQSHPRPPHWTGARAGSGLSWRAMWNPSLSTRQLQGHIGVPVSYLLLRWEHLLKVPSALSSRWNWTALRCLQRWGASGIGWKLSLVSSAMERTSTCHTSSWPF